MKGRRSLALHAFAVLSMPSLAISADGLKQQNPGAAWDMARGGQMLPALVLAERLFEADRMPAESLAQLMAVVGDGEGVEKLLWRDGAPVRDFAGEEALRFSIAPAIEAIVKLAANERVVILNESHHDQRHRALAMQLALRLREVGFTHLGAETFTDSIVDSMKDGAPDGQGGIYIVDPVFADFVRQAHRAGYRLFSYEQTAAQAEAAERAGMDARTAREEAQAANIRQVMAEDPHARLFIYVGGSHVLEDDDGGKAWMARILKRESGVDPLTIDQTSGTPHLSEARKGGLYRQVERRLSRYPAIARDESGRPFARPGTDITVFHPPDAAPTPRPNWLFMCGYRAPYDIPVTRSNSRRLVRAFPSSEPSGSVPSDQVLIERNAAVAFLMLPPGHYRIESQSEAGDSTVLEASFDTLKARVSWTLRGYQGAVACKHG